MLGIVSYELDYRLSWEINKELMMDFVRIDDHCVRHKRSGQDQYFTCFVYDDENTYLHYKLLSNRSDKGYLLEELKNIDYIVVVTGEYHSTLSTELRKKLLALESVQSCFILETGNIKNFQKVL